MSSTLQVVRSDYRVVVDGNGEYSIRRIYYDADGKIVGRRSLERLAAPNQVELANEVKEIGIALERPFVRFGRNGDLVEALAITDLR